MVMPWDLWMLIAHASFKGSCILVATTAPACSMVNSARSITLSSTRPSGSRNSTRGSNSLDDDEPPQPPPAAENIDDDAPPPSLPSPSVCSTNSFTVPLAPLHKPLSTSKFLSKITFAPTFNSSVCGEFPPLSSWSMKYFSPLSAAWNLNPSVRNPRSLSWLVRSATWLCAQSTVGQGSSYKTWCCALTSFCSDSGDKVLVRSSFRQSTKLWFFCRNTCFSTTARVITDPQLRAPKQNLMALLLDTGGS
mmetsp:Transcript_41131/g.69943  ORF Transcript_41131/g.69943 Transcript_41131/m.69943 type:complete len:249 (+) Transcript_41131:511-1257(+)